MRSLFILLLALMSIRSQAYSQKITYSGKNVPLKIVFSVIQKQTGYGFFYNQELLKQAKPVTLKVENAELKAVLSIVFKNQPLTYSIQSKTILVSKKKIAVDKKQAVIAKPAKAVDKVPSDKNIIFQKPTPADTKPVEKVPAYSSYYGDKPVVNTNLSPADTLKPSSTLSPETKIPDSIKSVPSLSSAEKGRFLSFLGNHRKSIFAELLGSGIGISVNFESRLKPNRNDGFGARVGIGILPSYIIMPLGIDYVIGKKRHGFEAGLTITSFFDTEFGSFPFYSAAAMFTAGYRFQPINNGPVVRLTGGLGHGLIGRNFGWISISDYYNRIIAPWPGFSIGYSFINTHSVSKPKKEPLPPITLNGQRRKVIYAEILGNSIGITINYDMRFKRDRNDGWGFRAGGGILPDYGENYLTVPLEINYILGRRQHGLEAGIGITSLYALQPNSNFVYDLPQGGYPTDRFLALGEGSLGYRYQSKKGFMARAYYTAMYDGLYYSRPFYPEGYVWIAFPGISLGYSFNKK